MNELCNFQFCDRPSRKNRFPNLDFKPYLGRPICLKCAISCLGPPRTTDEDALLEVLREENRASFQSFTDNLRQRELLKAADKKLRETLKREKPELYKEMGLKAFEHVLATNPVVAEAFYDMKYGSLYD